MIVPKKARSYNIRDLEAECAPKNNGDGSPDHGRRKKQAKGLEAAHSEPVPRPYTKKEVPVTKTRTARLKYCPECGKELPQIKDADEIPTSTKIVEDISQKGSWEKTKWFRQRRHCTSCNKRQTAPVPGVMSSQKFGNRLISLIITMRCCGISFGIMHDLLGYIWEIDIAESALQKMCATGAKKMRPLYKKLHSQIKGGKFANGDETGWFLNGQIRWVWTICTKTTVVYHISKHRNKATAQMLLDGFKGILGTDSLSAWYLCGRLINL